MLKKYRKLWAGIVATSLTLSMLVGNSFSRVIGWTTAAPLYISASASQYTSDCLTKEGQIILVSDWLGTESTKVISISISAPAATPAETLPDATDPTAATEEENRQVEVILDNNAAQYISYTAQLNEAGTAIDLVLARMEDPKLTENISISVTVVWNGLSGTFTMNMEAVPPEPTVPETTVPSETTAPTEVTTAPTEVTTAPTEVTTAPTEVTTAPTEVTTAPTEVTTAPTEVATEPTEVTTAPTEVTTAPTDGATKSTEVTTAPTEAITKPTQATTAPVSSENEISTADVVAPETYTVSATYEVQGALAWGKVSSEAMANCKFIFQEKEKPVYKVRFTFDGQQFFLLYDIYQVTLFQWAPADWNGDYLLDFSQVSTTSLTIDMISEASDYSGGLTFQYPLNEHCLVLTPSEPIALMGTVNLDMAIRDIQKLTAGEYTSVASSDWLPTYTEGKISLNTKELLPGSYRLVLDLKWNQISVMEQYIYFFVNLK